MFRSTALSQDTGSQSLFTASRSVWPALNDGAFEAGIATASPVRGAASGPCGPALRCERAEPAKAHRLFPGQRLGNRSEHRVDRTLGRGPAHSHPARHTADDVRLVHPLTPATVAGGQHTAPATARCIQRPRRNTLRWPVAELRARSTPARSKPCPRTSRSIDARPVSIAQHISLRYLHRRIAHPIRDRRAYRVHPWRPEETAGRR